MNVDVIVIVDDVVVNITTTSRFRLLGDLTREAFNDSFPKLGNLWAQGLFPPPCPRRQRARKPTVDSRVRLRSHRLKKTCTQIDSKLRGIPRSFSVFFPSRG